MLAIVLITTSIITVFESRYTLENQHAKFSASYVLSIFVFIPMQILGKGTLFLNLYFTFLESDSTWNPPIEDWKIETRQ